MDTIVEILSNNASLLASVIALIISLRASYIAHQAHQLNLKNKADTDRVLLFEKKRELLNEVDRQHTRFATLMMLTAQKILLFRENPELRDKMAPEFDRLKANLASVQALHSEYEDQRRDIEAIDVGADIAKELSSNLVYAS